MSHSPASLETSSSAGLSFGSQAVWSNCRDRWSMEGAGTCALHRRTMKTPCMAVSCPWEQGQVPSWARSGKFYLCRTLGWGWKSSTWGGSSAGVSPAWGKAEEQSTAVTMTIGSTGSVWATKRLAATQERFPSNPYLVCSLMNGNLTFYLKDCQLVGVLPSHPTSN